MPSKVVMTAEEMRRSLARMAHEIVERNKLSLFHHGCKEITVRVVGGDAAGHDRPGRFQA